MNKSQKIIIASTLLLMVFILIYPPVVKIKAPHIYFPQEETSCFHFQRVKIGKTLAIYK